MPETKIIAYKGFDKNLCCRGFQYEVGKEYLHTEKIKICESGFHACEYPIDIFNYYPPASSRYCEVELSGQTESGNDKTVASKIRIVRELTAGDLCVAAVQYTQSRVIDKKSNTGYQSSSSNTGDRSSSSNTGDRSSSSNTGDQSSSSNTGDQSSSLVTGNYSIASVEGNNSVAMGVGKECCVKANKPGSVIFLVERDDDGNILSAKCGIVGKDILPDVEYKLVNGEFVEHNQKEKNYERS